MGSVNFNVEGHTLTIDLRDLVSRLERTHTDTHCLIKQSTQHLACVKNATDAHLSLLSSEPLTYHAMIQSWAILFLPHENVFLLRNAVGAYLGWEAGTYRVEGSSATDDDRFLWKIEQVSTESSFYIRSNSGGKYLTSSNAVPGRQLVLNNTSSNESKWNFDISTTVPPGW